MQCSVYTSTRKANTYVWLAERDDSVRGDLGCLPESLLLLLGELRFVLELNLDDQRRLPQEDAATVLENLRTQGWHLQLPAQEALATAYPASPPESTPARRE